MEKPMIEIKIATETLSDGSKAFNVIIGGLKLSAVSELAAIKLANLMAVGINKHTSDKAESYFLRAGM